MIPQFMQSTSTLHTPIVSGSFNRTDIQRQILANAIQQDPGYLESLQIATNMYGYSAQTFDRQRSMMDMTETAKRNAWLEVNGFLMENWLLFDAYFAKWRENMGFKHHIHWTPADIKKITDAGQQAYISPHMWRWMMSLSGEQQSAETAWEVEARSPDSAQYAELANGVLKCYADINDWPRVNASMFDDGSVGGIGFGMCSLDPMNPRWKILIDRCPPWQFMWSREAKNGSLDGARIVTRGYWHSLEELIAKYPVWRETLLRYNPGAFYRDHQFLFRVQEPEVQSVVSNIGQNVTLTSEMMARVGHRVFVLEFYRRRPKLVFRVTDANFNIDHDFDNRAQANEFFALLREAYRAANIARYGQDGTDPMVIPPEEVYKTVTDQEIWCGDMILDKQTIDEVAAIPYESFIPSFKDGTITGFFEGEKSRERMRDRIMIYFDMLAAGAKSKVSINLAKLPRDLRNKPQEVKRIMSRANEILFIDDKSPDADISRVVNHSTVPNNGQLADQLLRFLDSGSSTTLGGMVSIGQPDFAGQSGISQRENAQGASMGTIPLMKEHNVFDRRMGEKVLINAQSLDPRRLIATTDKRNQPNFFRVIDHGIQSLSELKFGIRVMNVVDSPSVRDRKLHKVLMMLQNAGPELQSAVLPEILELSDMEISRVDRIMERYQQANEQASEQADEDRKTARLNLIMKWEDMKAHRANEKMNALTKAAPPINTTLQMKAVPGPGLITEIVNQHQIPANVQGVIADMATAALVQQPIEDMQQEHYNRMELQMQEELAAIQAKYAPPKEGGASTAKKAVGKGRPSGTGGKPLTPKNKRARAA